MTTLPNMSLTLPTRGPAGSGLWADAIDAVLGRIDEHDHSSGKGARVGVSGLNINADLSFGSSWAPTNVNRVSFAEVATPTQVQSLFVNSGDGELYWKSEGGTSVKVTSGSTLNVAAFTGGIGGDYTAVGAAVAFDDAGDRYTFKQNSPGFTWARLAAGEVRIFETGSTDTVFVGLAAPAALAVSYTMTWPTALPGSAQAVQVDNTGAFSFSNTFAQLITANAGLTAGSNQHVTVSGTGLYKHGTRTLQVAIKVPTSGAADMTSTASFTSNFAVLLPVLVGWRITLLRARIKDSAVGPTKLAIELWTQDAAHLDSNTVVASGAGTASAGSGAGQIITSAALTTDVASGTTYAANVKLTTGAAGCFLNYVEVDYTQP